MIDVGDFAITKGKYCEINILAIQILSILSLISASYSCSVIFRYLIIQCYKRRTIFIFTAKAKSLFPLFFLLFDATGIFVVSLKLTGSNIGRDILITVFMSVQNTFLFTGLVLYYFVVMNFLQMNMRGMVLIPGTVMGKIEKKLTELGLYAWAIPPLFVFFSLFPLFGLLIPEHQGIFWMGYFIGTGITSVIFSTVINFASGAFLTEISSHMSAVEGTSAESDDIKNIYRKIKLSGTGVAPIGLVIGLLTLSFGCSNLLLRVSTYFLMGAQIQVPLLLVVMLSSFFETDLNPFGRIIIFAEFRIKAFPDHRRDSIDNP